MNLQPTFAFKANIAKLYFLLMSGNIPVQKNLLSLILLSQIAPFRTSSRPVYIVLTFKKWFVVGAHKATTSQWTDNNIRERVGSD